MVYNPADPFPPEPDLNNPEVLATASAAARVSSGKINAAIANIIDRPRVAKVTRELVTWKTPHMGYVQMYINPQMIRIDSGKVIGVQRTKGGFVIQYGGENLDTIAISGTTGSSGIEGINILQSIYRSEQLAFEGIATALDEQLSNVQLDQTIGAIASQFGASGSVTGSDVLFGQNVLQITSQLFSGLNKPRPTLASLASNIDMFFQGVLYRGFFESFSVTEDARTPGLFTYDLKFTAYARQGIRRNFMPWHKQPNGPAGSSNPLTFTELNEPLEIQKTNPARNEKAGGADHSPFKDTFDSSNIRSVSSDFNGNNIKGLDLRR
jgi:hypothetical protein